MQRAIEHLADVVVVSHLGTLQARTPWWVVTEAAELITRTQRYPRWSIVAVSAEPQL
ncbi:hypothetical protein [Nocardia cyriacigeorgica]|uniref:hypothetical protein n=1 Tax=Nocardia cyriacigeorgica TaxID=135487 RepID=UPI0013D0EF02|nr:hypothetical protein [Nocardia cyriacigeorgica]NEW26747.1 hypothetical protein [Nocardia cyriacigeorgica]